MRARFCSACGGALPADVSGEVTAADGAETCCPTCGAREAVSRADPEPGSGLTSQAGLAGEVEGGPEARGMRLDPPGSGQVIARAGAVVRRAEHVLLCRSRRAPLGWRLPGGPQRPGEAIENAAVRGVREASGLVVRLTGLLDVLDVRDDPVGQAVLVVYTGEELDGELLPGDGWAEIAFHELGSLPRDLAFDSDRIILQRLNSGKERTW